MRILAFYFLIQWQGRQFENGPFFSFAACEEAREILHRAAIDVPTIKVWRCVAR